MLRLLEMDAHRQLRRSIAALDTGSGKPLVVRLEPGQVVRLVGHARESGLVDIISEGRLYTVFNADLVERSDEVLAAAK